MASVCLHNWCNLEQTDILFLRQTENDFQTGDIQEFTGLWPGFDRDLTFENSKIVPIFQTPIFNRQNFCPFQSNKSFTLTRISPWKDFHPNTNFTLTGILTWHEFYANTNSTQTRIFTNTNFTLTRISP